MLFVDTSAWFAVYVPNDPKHTEIQQVLSSAPRLVTTDYIFDETITLLRVRGHVDRAYHFGPHLLNGGAAKFEYIQPSDIENAWIAFAQFRDKAWSFTDCTSYVVMKRLGITTAISLDNHFRQMPGISVADLTA
jgi:predicted nucleic acid-binding protein